MCLVTCALILQMSPASTSLAAEAEDSFSPDLDIGSVILDPSEVALAGSSADAHEEHRFAHVHA
jgi:hypothetical protein